MSPSKGIVKEAYMNIIPSKEDVDYCKIYMYNNIDAVSKFNTFDGNRNLSKSHVSEICKDIQGGDKNPYKAKFFSPIRIDINTMCVADGQHRLEAFKMAWNNGSNEPMKVVFEDYPSERIMDIISKINSSSKNWTVTDYIHKMEQEQEPSMVNITDFGMTHRLCQKLNKKGEVVDYYPRYASAILFGKNFTKDIKNGSVHITEGQLSFGNKMHDELQMLIDALGYELNSWFESFAHAWYEIRSTDYGYNQYIDTIGLNTICANIKYFFNGKQIVTRKSEWARRFREVIYKIAEGYK